MKINALTFAGIGPYKDEQHIDFDALELDGIYLISGKTGAGKSTILDAICFALYNAVPRFDGASTQPRLRSDYCAPDDPSRVALEFSVHEERYRVTRTPEYVRPAKRGGGLTTQKQTALLERLDDGEWRGIAARPVDVYPEVERLVGLNRDQFLQVILLAQNRFQEFLLAKNDDRLAVLRSLFGTRRFGELEDHLAAKRSALKGEVEALGDSLHSLAERAAATARLTPGETGDAVPDNPTTAWFEAVAVSLEPELRAAEERQESAARRLDAADERVTRARDLARRQQRRRDAERARDTHLADAAEIDGVRERLSDHERAHALWSLVEGLAAASDAADRADEAADRAGRDLTEHVEASRSLPTETSGRPGIDHVARLAETANRSLGEVSQALHDEETSERLAAEADDLEQRVNEIDGRVAENRARLDVIPEMLHDLRAHLEALRREAGRADEARHRVDELRSQATAAQKAETAATAADAALHAEGEAHARHAAASQALSALYARRLNGDAAHLAADLIDGEPCAVCGSTDHPRPAVADGEAVGDAALEEARDDVDRTRAAVDAATERRRAADAHLAELRVSSGGREIEAISADLDAAVADLAAAQKAEHDTETAQRELDRLDREQVDASAAVDQLHLERVVVADSLAGHRARIAEANARVDAQKDGHASIAERVSALHRTIDAATTYLTAAERARTADTAHEQARAGLDRALADSGIDTLDDLIAAHLAADDVLAARARVAAHEEGLAAARAALADDELRELAAEPADIDAAERERDETREQRDTASDARAALRERQRTLDGIVADARRTLATGGEKLERYAVVRGLANALEGKEPNDKRMHLEAFVLAAELEEIIAAANVRLGTMTSGRFRLEHDDTRAYRGASSGLGLAIRDEYTGRARSTASLSGGETFLASLALALGLAEVVTGRAGGITLETLFVDEGFGSLDRETLDITLSTLDSLRTGGRTVGLISHVDAMKEQIPSRLRITTGPTGASTVHQEHSDTAASGTGPPAAALTA